MQLVWFKTADLRVSDNSALHYACQQGDTLCAFIVTPEQYAQHDEAEIKQDFWYRNLVELSASLAKLNIPLKVIIAKTFSDVPKRLMKLAKEFAVTDIHFNQQYEVNEAEMEDAVCRVFQKNKLNTHSYIDQVIFEPGEIRTGKGDYYTVFTPFKKNFLKTYKERSLQVFKKPKKQKDLGIASDEIKPWLKESNLRADIWKAGEKEAHKRLKNFVVSRAEAYQSARDIPSINGTSVLSPYLAAGVVSIRQCFQMIEQEFGSNLPEGVATWQSELIWREFYKHILVGFPRVSRHRAFKVDTERLVWHQNDEHFTAWKEGRTGVPIVDAAMRQLKQTGWMHNRLRMVAAMFLSKNLFLDWRLGEQYFMQKLIDGDLSANNGGWQWSASTGTDAAPYFRIFNPVSQSQRFDPDGKFIRKFVPELSACDNKAIHDPWNAKTRPIKLDYPKLIVDLKSTRAYAIERFKQNQNK